MNPLLDHPVWISSTGSTSDATAIARELAAGSYDLVTQLYRGTGGSFRVGIHGTRVAVLLVPEERADDLTRFWLGHSAAGHERRARELRWSADDAIEADDPGEAEDCIGEAELHEEQARSIRAEIARLESIDAERQQARAS